MLEGSLRAALLRAKLNTQVPSCQAEGLPGSEEAPQPGDPGEGQTLGYLGLQGNGR